MKPSLQNAKATPHEIAAALEIELPAVQIARAIGEALSATTITKSGVAVADHRTRMQAAELGLAYLIGRPTTRTESVVVNLDADASLGIEERLAKSPALRDQLRRSLAAADAAATDP
jgi:hypothetical protein